MKNEIIKPTDGKKMEVDLSDADVIYIELDLANEKMTDKQLLDLIL